MRARVVVVAILALISCGVTACSSLLGKWKPAAEPAPRAVVVESRRPWTDTGIDVNATQLLFFTATGEVRWAALGKVGTGVGPDGVGGDPGWRVGRGGLVGRVGPAGSVFDIGARTRPFPDKHPRRPDRYYPAPPIRMPVSGRLYLGFKNYAAGDNHGAFEVTIRAAEPITSDRK